MTLHLYFARRFAKSLAMVLAALALILTMFDLVEQVRRHELSEIGLSGALGLAALNMPETLYAGLPIAAMLAAISYFLALSRSAELVVARGAGRSAAQTLLAPVLTACLAGALAVLVLNPLTAALGQRYDELTARLSGSRATLTLGREGLWLRQSGAGAGQVVIHAARAGADGAELEEVTFIGFGAGSVPRWRIAAESARLTDGEWRIETAKRWRLDASNPEAEAERHAVMTLPTDLTRTRIRDSFRSPQSIGLWKMPQFIADIEAAGFSSLTHRVWFQMQLAMPALFAAMVLLAAGFTMAPARSGRTAPRVMAAFGLGLTLYFLRNFARVLGESGQAPVPLAAWAPPVAGLLMATGLILHAEEG